MDIILETTVPAPIHLRARFAAMEVGTNVLIREGTFQAIHAARMALAKLHKTTEMRFVTRTVDEGVRVWRTK